MKKVRWMSCLPERVLSRYPDFVAALHENAIELDVAPRNAIMSWVEGKNVTSPDFLWLVKSVDCQRLEAWATQGNFYCTRDDWTGCNRTQASYCLPK